ncbi:homoserine dehydrogenase [Neisseriaceae bacterium PsAf]|nr:homoserine dehydrogenase [Neisseriaceae bacterium PsAf]MCV2502507.1 homoserine dehydrogenase [Neisseriaceae bacterium]
MAPINIGIMGVGTVGKGTIEVLTKNQLEIQKKLGKALNIFMVACKNIENAKEVCPADTIITDDAFDIVQHPEIDIVVELIGGSTIARDLVLQAIENGKHVVTANKKLLAEYGNEIFAAAEANQVTVKFEAAVAGGIPIIKVLREGLAANNIQWIAGIINGTSNFILTQMKDKGEDFELALEQAQQLGYAEADPTFDVEGHDAGHKITIMAALAFGIPIDFSHCYLEGISHLQSKDIAYANELGYQVKLLGITKKTDEGIELRVHPTLIPEDRLIASVNGVMNAVYVNSDMLGKSLYYGAGAGSLPTASAVTADLIDLSRELINQVKYPVPHLSYLSSEVREQPFVSINEIRSSYYLRMAVRDQLGVLSELTKIFVKHDVSIEVMIQKSDFKEGIAEIIILTHSTIENNIKNVIAQMESLDAIVGSVTMIRMESFYK